MYLIWLINLYISDDIHTHLCTLAYKPTYTHTHTNTCMQQLIVEVSSAITSKSYNSINMRDSKKGFAACCWRIHWIELNIVDVCLVLVKLVRIQICWCRRCQSVEWTKHSAALILLSLVWGYWAVSSRFLHFISRLWVICTRVCRIPKSEYQLRRVCPSVHMEQLCSHWMDFYEIWYLSIFKKSVKKIQVSLKLDKNNWYFTCRLVYIFCILLRSS